jgi:endo-1,4-beta-xylanase
MENHIAHEAGHWKDQCYAWDVVNEALNDDGTFGNDSFFNIIGQEYIRIAFRAAAKADPKAKLYYNDFNIEFVGSKSPRGSHRRHANRIQINRTAPAKISLNTSKKTEVSTLFPPSLSLMFLIKNFFIVRIDGIGLQAHFIVGETPTLADQLENIKLFTDMGIEVAYTELDVRLEEPETPENLEQQKLDYMTTVEACMQSKKCIGMTVWDFYDPVSPS